jgi:hypothetical protein
MKCVPEIARICGALSVRQIFLPAESAALRIAYESRREAEKLYEETCSGDPFVLAASVKRYEEVRIRSGCNAAQAWCKAAGLHPGALSEASSIAEQLKRLLEGDVGAGLRSLGGEWAASVTHVDPNAAAKCLLLGYQDMLFSHWKQDFYFSAYSDPGPQAELTSRESVLRTSLERAKRETVICTGLRDRARGGPAICNVTCMERKWVKELFPARTLEAMPQNNRSWFMNA